MKKIATLFMAFIAITAISFATPGDKLSSNRLMNAFLPNHLSGKNQSFTNTQDQLNTINDLNSAKQKLDSAVAYDVEFDVGIKVDGRMVFKYNELGQVTSSTMKIYLSGTSTSVYSFSYLYEYDQSGRIITYTQSMTNNQKYSQTTYTYNPDNTLATETISNWDDNAGDWIVMTKFEYTYNANKQILTTLEYGSNIPGTLNLTNKVEYSYDNSSKITESNTYAWYEAWFKKGTDTYVYNNNRLAAVTSYAVEIDENGNEKLVFNQQENYEYDAAGNRNIIINYIKNVGSEELVPISKEVYKYNNDYNINDLILPFTPSENDMKENFTHMIVSNMSYYYDNGVLADSSESKYYYSDFSGSSIFDDRFTTAQIAPNPCMEYITFNWESNEVTLEVTIYDLSGQEVFRETVTKGEGVSVNDLRTGAYIYKLSTAGKTLYGGKIVIM